jgi:hypothetical protein
VHGGTWHSMTPDEHSRQSVSPAGQASAPASAADASSSGKRAAASASGGPVAPSAPREPAAASGTRPASATLGTVAVPPQPTASRAARRRERILQEWPDASAPAKALRTAVAPKALPPLPGAVAPLAAAPSTWPYPQMPN